MKPELVAELKHRNSRIISAVIEKTRRVCPGSVALIGIAGSFHTGAVHERSDLDLCIVINDDDGWKVASCFILNEVGFDLYCTPWGKLEAMAEYTTSHVTKLLDLDIVYQADEAALARYMALRKSVQEKLKAPFSLEDAKNVDRHLADALRAYASVMLGGTTAECKVASAGMLVSLEQLIYLANKSYVRRGIRGIPEELRAMPRLPRRFWPDHQRLIAAGSRDGIRAGSTRLMKNTQAFVAAIKESVTTRKEPTRDDLRGSYYEEIVSNWRNKMHLAAHTQDAYLALMTMASCQEFYDWMAADYAIDRIPLYAGFRADDLSRSAAEFDAAMERYRSLYTRAGEPVREYASLDAFEKAYLDGE